MRGAALSVRLTQLKDLSESARALRSGQSLILRLMPRILALPYRSASLGNALAQQRPDHILMKDFPLRKGGQWHRRRVVGAAPRAPRASAKLIRFDLGAECDLVHPNLLSVLPSIRTIQQPSLHFTLNRRLEITCIHARVLNPARRSKSSTASRNRSACSE